MYRAILGLCACVRSRARLKRHSTAAATAELAVDGYPTAMQRMQLHITCGTNSSDKTPEERRNQVMHLYGSICHSCCWRLRGIGMCQRQDCCTWLPGSYPLHSTHGQRCPNGNDNERSQ